MSPNYLHGKHNTLVRWLIGAVIISLICCPTVSGSLAFAEERTEPQTQESSPIPTPETITTPDALQEPPPSEPESIIPPTTENQAPTQPEEIANLASEIPSESPTTSTSTSEAATIIESLEAEIPAEELSSSTPPSTSTNGQDGQNAPISNASSAVIIDTGDATAVANVMNVVNTTVVDSSGFVSFLNSFGGITGDVSVNEIGLDAGGCEGACETTVSYIIQTTSTAEVVNDLTVTADTGKNTLEGFSRTNVNINRVNTGNAYAAANVVNLVNTQIIHSNYMLLVLNNFADWAGDLVLPGKSFFENFLGGNSAIEQNISLMSSSSAQVSNESTVVAETGSNTQEGEGNIETGNATAITNTANFVNQNFINGNSVYILVRVLGNWNGQIMSLPGGIAWQHTPNGILIYDEDLGEPGEDCCGSESETSLTNETIASIKNKLQVYALTGQNRITGNGSIETGNATAIANTVNIANSTIIGRNFMTALVTVNGDWNGNLAFGKPNLWVAERAETSINPLSPASRATFTIEVANNGNADATGVVIESKFSKDALVPIIKGGGIATNTGLSWHIGSLPIGATTSVSYTAQVSDNIPFGESIVTVEAQGKSFENDGNNTDNSDTLSLGLYRKNVGKGDMYLWNSLDHQLSITKTSNASGTPVEAGATVHYTLAIKNNEKAPIYNAVVIDTLKNPSGTIVRSDSWDLKELAPLEEITIEYDAKFESTTMPGAYTNEASIEGVNGYNQEPKSFASHTIIVFAASSTAANGGSASAEINESKTTTTTPPQVTNTTSGGNVKKTHPIITRVEKPIEPLAAAPTTTETEATTSPAQTYTLAYAKPMETQNYAGLLWILGEEWGVRFLMLALFLAILLVFFLISKQRKNTLLFLILLLSVLLYMTVQESDDAPKQAFVKHEAEAAAIPPQSN